MSRREALEHVEESTGHRPADLDPPSYPEEFEYLWRWFIELQQGRQAGGMGPSPIAYTDIEAWARLLNRRPLPWQVEVLKAIDREFMAMQS